MKYGSIPTSFSLSATSPSDHRSCNVTDLVLINLNKGRSIPGSSLDSISGHSDFQSTIGVGITVCEKYSFIILFIIKFG
jgi:hypothetical protein